MYDGDWDEWLILVSQKVKGAEAGSSTTTLGIFLVLDRPILARAIAYLWFIRLYIYSHNELLNESRKHLLNILGVPSGQSLLCSRGMKQKNESNRSIKY